MSITVLKRKASSPCVSSKGKAKVLDLNTTFESANSSSDLSKSKVLNSTFASAGSAMGLDTTMTSKTTEKIYYRISKRNGEPFFGSLTRAQGLSIWKKALELDGNLLFGIALIQSDDKPFMFVFRLREEIEEDLIKKEIDFLIEEAEYVGEFVPPRPPPPKLGEEVRILVTKTRYNLEPEQIEAWIASFGTVVKAAKYTEADDCPGIATDDIECVAKLRKHIPGIIPAFGRRAYIRYPGQPLLCGKCFDIGHLRAKCAKDSVSWMSYVKFFIKEKVCDLSLLGEWVQRAEAEKNQEA